MNADSLQIPEWQRRMIDALENDGKITLIQPRSYGRHEAMAWMLALDEILMHPGPKIVGADEDQVRSLRRRSREIAAEFSERVDPTT